MKQISIMFIPYLLNQTTNFSQAQDEQSSIIECDYDYSPYGAATAEGLDQPIQYSSEYHDPEIALTYYNYRHYNPTDGRWINRDPISEDGGFNLYGFVSNSSGIYIDILGNFLGLAIAGALVISAVIVTAVSKMRKKVDLYERDMDKLFNDKIPNGDVAGAIEVQKEMGKHMNSIKKDVVDLAKIIPGTSITGYPHPITIDILDLIVEGIIPEEEAKDIKTIVDIIQLVNTLRTLRSYPKDCYTEKDKERLDERIREIDEYLKSKGYDRVGNPKGYHEYVDGHLN